jgi:hypothetical protein
MLRSLAPPFQHLERIYLSIHSSWDDREVQQTTHATRMDGCMKTIIQNNDVSKLIRMQINFT